MAERSRLGVSVYERLPVEAEPEVVVAALRLALRERGLREYALVDHGHELAAVGAPAYRAWTLILGEPSGAAQLLGRELAAAIDIPLRLAVIGMSSGGSEIVLRDTRSLLPDGLDEQADAFTSTLRVLAARARELAASESPSQTQSSDRS